MSGAAMGSKAREKSMRDMDGVSGGWEVECWRIRAVALDSLRAGRRWEGHWGRRVVVEESRKALAMDFRVVASWVDS